MPVHASHETGAAGSGQTSGDLRPSELQVTTGVLDDHRAPLAIGHQLFEPALLAWQTQDAWTDRECELFWTALLAAWPRSKAPGTADRQERAWIASVLHDANKATVKQVAEALGYSEDTTRRLIRDGRAMTELQGRPPTRVPRVWSAGEEERPEPPFHYVIEPPPTRFERDHPEAEPYAWQEEDGTIVFAGPLIPLEPPSSRETYARQKGNSS